jgi:LmbE family N-acetylglucosaminyl deacetylase
MFSQGKCGRQREDKTGGNRCRGRHRQHLADLMEPLARQARAVAPRAATDTMQRRILVSRAALTLMAVHAHPDDEASTTGGILARYSAESLRTVVVTCTNGELGDGHEASKPGDAGHDEALVVATRRRELESSCEILGVTDLELLGYHDSGMMGWPQNDAEGSFWTTPVAEAAERLSELIELYRPQVVVTYDANGFYGHPDHIQAHRITVAALEATPVPDKLYYPAIPKSGLAEFREALLRAGVEAPDIDQDEDWDFGVDDELISATVDCTAYAAMQYSALEAHASQIDGTFFLRLGVDLFSKLMGHEKFVRAYDRTGAPTPEDDLFAGLRE